MGNNGGSCGSLVTCTGTFSNSGCGSFSITASCITGTARFVGGIPGLRFAARTSVVNRCATILGTTCSTFTGLRGDFTNVSGKAVVSEAANSAGNSDNSSIGICLDNTVAGTICFGALGNSRSFAAPCGLALSGC